jgi:hypothetical protein
MLENLLHLSMHQLVKMIAADIVMKFVMKTEGD